MPSMKLASSEAFYTTHGCQWGPGEDSKAGAHPEDPEQIVSPTVTRKIKSHTSC